MSAKPYDAEELAHFREWIARIDAGGNGTLPSKEVRRFMATIAARDAELARLRAAVPADDATRFRQDESAWPAAVSEARDRLVNHLVQYKHGARSEASTYDELDALIALALRPFAVPADVAGLVAALRKVFGFDTVDSAADALEAQARELATAQRDAAEAQQFMDDNIHALDELPRLKRELAAKDEALRLEVAKRAKISLILIDLQTNDEEHRRVLRFLGDLDPDARAMLDKIAKLEAVAKYAQHADTCRYRNADCDCGVNAALAQLDDVSKSDTVSIGDTP